MVRWIRIVALVLVALGFIALGVAMGLYLVANWRWVPVETPEMLHGLLGEVEREVFLPALLGGWLVGVLGLGGLLAWLMFYAWRRRQFEVLVRRLERELAELRNLPFKRPAPLEDLPAEGDDDEVGVLDERGEAVEVDPVRDVDADEGEDAEDGGLADRDSSYGQGGSVGEGVGGGNRDRAGDPDRDRDRTGDRDRDRDRTGDGDGDRVGDGDGDLDSNADGQGVGD